MTGHSTFPAGFLWGAATAAHQVEGNNVASDIWGLETMPGSPLPERSGDACDSYHRWREDLDIVADLGLDSYRFSIEWSRIEPTPGQISRAALQHYARMIAGCLERGLTPVVTLHHFTSPLWFTRAGGWTAEEGVARFRAYAHAVLPILDGVPWVCTINEPNMLAMIARLRSGGGSGGSGEAGAVAGGLAEPEQGLVDALVAAHRAAREELAAVPGLRSGWTVANQNFQAATPAGVPARDAWARLREDQFIDAAAEDDFIGVQAYTRLRIDAKGAVPLAPGTPTTQTGWEIYPGAAEQAIRYTAGRIDVPILVTENGIATDDDEQRVEYLTGAIDGVGRALADGIDVRGYLAWSLLDNYEWGSWHPRFGLVAVDRTTFERTVKPSGRWYGEHVQRLR